jgi:hypothetical protein
MRIVLAMAARALIPDLMAVIPDWPDGSPYHGSHIVEAPSILT